MGNIKQINIENRTYYFFNDMINIGDFCLNLLKIDKKSYKNINVYYIGYITIRKIDYYENIYSVNPFYLITGKVVEFIKEKNESRYLGFDSTNENKEVLKNYTEVWDGIKNEVKTINGGKKIEYAKHFMKIKFDS